MQKLMKSVQNSKRLVSRSKIPNKALIGLIPKSSCLLGIFCNKEVGNKIQEIGDRRSKTFTSNT